MFVFFFSSLAAINPSVFPILYLLELNAHKLFIIKALELTLLTSNFTLRKSVVISIFFFAFFWDAFVKHDFICTNSTETSGVHPEMKRCVLDAAFMKCAGVRHRQTVSCKATSCSKLPGWELMTVCFSNSYCWHAKSFSSTLSSCKCKRRTHVHSDLNTYE